MTLYKTTQSVDTFKSVRTGEKKESPVCDRFQLDIWINGVRGVELDMGGEKKKKKISLELKNKTKHADKLQMSNLKKGYFQTTLTVTRPVSKNV